MKNDAMKSFFRDSSDVPVKKEKTVSKLVEPKKESVEDVKKPNFFARIFNGIMRVSIVMIFFGLPLFFTGLSLQGVSFEKQMYFYFWTLLGLVAWASKGVLEESMKIRRTLLDIPIIVLWFVYLLATIFSVDKWHSFWGFFGDPSRGLMSVTAIIIFYYLVLSNFNEKLFKWMLGAFVVSGAMLSLWTAIVIMGVNILPDQVTNIISIPLSLLGSVGSLGAFFSLMLPLLIITIFKIQSDDHLNSFIKYVITTLTILILIVDLVLIWSIHPYVPWLGILLGMILLLVYILSKVVKVPANWTWLPMVTFVFLLVIYLVGPINIARVDIPAEIGPTHKISWGVAKNSLKDNFILGSGPATYGYDFSLHRPQDFNLNDLYSLRFYQGTGILFESLSTLGALGTLALLLVIVSFVSVSIYFVARNKEMDKVYSLGLLTTAVIIITDSLIAKTNGAMLLIGSALSILAMAIIFKEAKVEEIYSAFTLKASAKFALTLAFIFMVISAGVIFLFVFIGKAYLADVYAGSAAKNNSIEKFDKAINLFGKEGRYYTRLGQEYMILANQEMLKPQAERNIGNIENYVNKSIEFSKKGSDLMKNDVGAIESLGLIYENTSLFVVDSIKLAEESYRRALELEPHNPNFYIKLGQIKLGLAMAGKDTAGSSNSDRNAIVDEAIKLFEQAIGEKNDLAVGYYYLALAYENKGEIDAAIENSQKAVSFERSVNNIFTLARLYQIRGGDDDNNLAEAFLNKILGVNDKEINTHLSLGMLYEKTNRKSEAIKEYRRVIELLPIESQSAIDKVNEMINNVIGGVDNSLGNNNVSNDSQDEEVIIGEEESATETESVVQEEVPVNSDVSPSN